jgi:beta-mannosidase
VQLTGPWRASVADDDLRRSAVDLGYDDSSWPQIEVPGHWRSHPAFAENDRAVLYRTAVSQPIPEPGRRRFLSFEGIFYQADVFYDGAYLGDHEGYFVPATFEVTDLARLTDEHVVAVEVSCPVQRAATKKRSLTGVFQSSEIIDPAWNPAGIWRPVRIIDTGPVRIDRLRVLCRDVNDERAHLRVRARLDAADAAQIRLRTSADGVVIDEQEHSLARGANEVAWNIDIDQPRLWWPWSLGEQQLTDISVEVLIGGAVSDDHSVRTGLREVALQDWAFSVNGERLFAKGACLAPTRAALGEATAEEVRRDVLLAREAGLDLLRVYAHIGRPELYEAADELGMLLWQDHPLQHAYIRSVRHQAVQQAVAAVDLLGHHPSIAVWCAHDEPMGPQTAPSGGSRRSLAAFIARQQAPSWNVSILDRWVKRAFERADETRPVIAHSGVLPHLPLLEGTDSHLFFGWTQGDERDLPTFAAAIPRMVRFVSEFGAQSVPDHDEFIDPHRWPSLDWDHLAEHHGLQRDAFERVLAATDFDDFDSWKAATQRYQADVIRHSVETLRRLKYRPTGGFCVFFLNDPAPMISASLLDHRRSPKPAYHTLIDACRPVIVVADRLPDTVHTGAAVGLDVHVVNDTRQQLERATCTASLHWPGGHHTWRWEGDVGADDCVRVGTLRFLVADAPGSLVLDLTLEHGEEIATNRYEAQIVR